MPKRGDVVLYSQTGKTYNAIVLMVHALNDSHLGALLEPQLHLAVLFDDPQSVFLPPPAKPGTPKPGYIPEPTIVYDVVHASHEFSQAYMQSHGLRNLRDGDPHRAGAEAEIRNRRGAGEWREVPVAVQNGLEKALLKLSPKPTDIVFVDSLAIDLEAIAALEVPEELTGTQFFAVRLQPGMTLTETIRAADREQVELALKSEPQE